MPKKNKKKPANASTDDPAWYYLRKNETPEQFLIRLRRLGEKEARESKDKEERERKEQNFALFRQYMSQKEDNRQISLHKDVIDQIHKAYQQNKAYQQTSTGNPYFLDI